MNESKPIRFKLHPKLDRQTVENCSANCKQHLVTLTLLSQPQAFAFVALATSIRAIWKLRPSLSLLTRSLVDTFHSRENPKAWTSNAFMPEFFDDDCVTPLRQELMGQDFRTEARCRAISLSVAQGKIADFRAAGMSMSSFGHS